MGHNSPISIFTNQAIVGSSERWTLKYFRSHAGAESAVSGVHGAFTIKTSPGIWRATIPEGVA